MPYTVYENSLLAYDIDIKNRSFLEWLAAHTSFLKPLHRYQGVLKVDEEAVVFDGKNKNGYVEFNLTILIDNIIEVFLGYDELFRRREDRSLGLRGFEPLRIRFETKRGQQTIYIFVGYHWMRTSQNRRLYKQLQTFSNNS